MTSDFILKVGCWLGISEGTIYIAAHYVGVALGCTLIPKPHLKLLCLSSILLAAKYDELDMCIPRVQILKKFALDVYDEEQFKWAENFFAKIFDWDFHINTIMNFLDMTFSQGVIFEDDKIAVLHPTFFGCKAIEYKHVQKVEKCSKYFSRLSLRCEPVF